jgi:hypothetical protein
MPKKKKDGRERWIRASQIPASGIPEGYGVILDDSSLKPPVPPKPRESPGEEEERPGDEHPT